MQSAYKSHQPLAWSRFQILMGSLGIIVRARIWRTRQSYRPHQDFSHTRMCQTAQKSGFVSKVSCVSVTKDETVSVTLFTHVFAFLFPAKGGFGNIQSSACIEIWVGAGGLKNSWLGEMRLYWKYSHISAVTADAKQWWGEIRSFAILSRHQSNNLLLLWIFLRHTFLLKS